MISRLVVGAYCLTLADATLHTAASPAAFAFVTSDLDSTLKSVTKAAQRKAPRKSKN